MRNRTTEKMLCAAVTLAALMIVAVSAHASITLAEGQPVVGEQVQLELSGEEGPLAEVEVVATYYPGSRVSYEETIGKTDSAGHLEWKPTTPGLVTLKAGCSKDDAGKESCKATKTVSVRYDGLPVSGLAVFLAATFLLTGGILFGGYKAQSPNYGEE